jgi:hypothetical protein
LTRISERSTLKKFENLTEEVAFLFKTINGRCNRKHKTTKMNGFWDPKGWSELKTGNKIKED